MQFSFTLFRSVLDTTQRECVVCVYIYILHCRFSRLDKIGLIAFCFHSVPFLIYMPFDFASLIVREPNIKQQISTNTNTHTQANERNEMKRA